MTEERADMPLDEELPQEDEAPETVPVPRSLVGHLNETAVLLDIDGTLLDFAPTPREVWVPPGLAKTLNRLLQRTDGALALVSGRSLNDIDLIFAPERFPRSAAMARKCGSTPTAKRSPRMLRRWTRN